MQFRREERDGSEAISYHKREHEELHVNRESGRRVEHLPTDISTFYTPESSSPQDDLPPRVAIRWHWQN